jgi:penicillin-binding protein 2
LKDYFADKEPVELKSRLRLPTALVVVAFFLVAARLWQLQVMDSAHYSKLSLSNSVRLIKNAAPRGIVFDREGIRLADNQPGFDLSITPEDATDMDLVVKKVSALAEVDEASILERLKKARKRPAFEAVKIKDNLTWEELVRLEASRFKLPGVALSVVPKRRYPFGEATAHLLGYIGEISEQELRASSEAEGAPYDGGDMIGKYGVERSHEEHIRGRDGGRQVEVDALGREINVLESIRPVPGFDVHTTVDAVAQLAAWRAMNGQAGAVVAIEPSTGEILAMFSSPAFDPEAVSTGVSREEWDALMSNPMNVFNNRAIQGQYPPASTFKLITAAAALEEKVVTPRTVKYAGPAYRFAGRDYRDWKEEGHGNINVHRAIVESADTFFYQVGVELGIEKLSKYAAGFGFGSKTGIGLKNEKAGVVPSGAWKKKALGEQWYPGETISASVGQGYMLTTPLQLAMAYAAMANGGTLHQPLLVKKVAGHDGRVIKDFTADRAPGKKVPVSAETLAVLREALRGVVAEAGGTARSLSWNDFEIAGKTGTAQVVAMKERIDNIEKIPYKYRDHAWFAGFAPYNDPKIAVAVIVEHGGFGSRAAAPVALEVIGSYLMAERARAAATEAAANETAPDGAPAIDENASVPLPAPSPTPAPPKKDVQPKDGLKAPVERTTAVERKSPING